MYKERYAPYTDLHSDVGVSLVSRTQRDMCVRYKRYYVYTRTYHCTRVYTYAIRDRVVLLENLKLSKSRRRRRRRGNIISRTLLGTCV